MEQNISLITKQLLENRGIKSKQEMLDFLYPNFSQLIDPFSIPGMEDAVNIILSHKNKKILIFGDYDCDGICGSAMFYKVLVEKGYIVDVFLPDREIDGYGLNIISLEKIFARNKPDLLITVDCGITSTKEIEYCHSLGIKTIITDHHIIGDTIPSCTVVNWRLGENLPELSGAGIVFNIIRAIWGNDESIKHIDLCAFSTIADMVPLIRDNRLIAKQGLKVINNKECCIGIKALIETLNTNDNLDANDVGFKLIPMINASGRISTPKEAFNLLISSNIYEAQQIASKLSLINQKRQYLCDVAYQEALQMLTDYDLVNNWVIVIRNDNWDLGILGLIASKMSDIFNRPVVVFTKKENILKGSCRSINGINIYELLANTQGIKEFGGHSLAAGLTIENDKFDVFKKSINNYAKKCINTEFLHRKNKSEIEISINEISLKLLEELNLMEPYGIGNNIPVFSMSNNNNFKFSQIKESRHIKYKHSQDLSFIAFNSIDWLGTINSTPTKMFFVIKENSWLNKKSINCVIRNFETSCVGINPHNIITQDIKRLLPIDELPLQLPKIEKSNAKPAQFSFNSCEDIFGTIFLVYNEITFNFLKEKYPHFQCFYRYYRDSNPENRIVLAPEKYIDLSYYEKIIICDFPPNAYVKNMQNKYGAGVIFENYDFNNQNNLHFANITLDELRAGYKYFYNALNYKQFYSLDATYAFLKNKYGNDYIQNFTTFLLTFIIFCEVGIISLNVDGVIMISNDKINLELKSSIYNMFKKK